MRNLFWVLYEDWDLFQVEQDLKYSRKVLRQFRVDVENNECCGSSWYDSSQVATVWKLSPPSKKYQIIVGMMRSIPVKKLKVIGHSENLLLMIWYLGSIPHTNSTYTDHSYDTDTYIWIGCSPSQSGKWRFSSGSPNNGENPGGDWNPGWGSTPNYVDDTDGNNHNAAVGLGKPVLIYLVKTLRL